MTNCITEINNTQVDDAEDIDIVMSMCNLIKCCDAYLKTSGSLYQYYRDEPAINDNCNITDSAANNNDITSLKFKQKILRKTGNGGTRDVKIMVP